MEAHRAVYADSSPLIGLARIDRLDLLALLPGPIRVTHVVWQEVTGQSDQPGRSALLEAERAGLIVVVQEGDPGDYPMLDRGEASVLSAARATSGAVIVDDRKARRILETAPELRDSVPYLATVALILLAKRRQVIERVRPMLDALRQESFRISPGLYEAALRASKEWPPGAI